MKVNTKKRERKSFGNFKNATTELKQQKGKEICKNKQNKELRCVLGKLLEDRYFVMKHLGMANCWLCWDLQSKREVILPSQLPSTLTSEKDRNLETEDKPANTQGNCETSVVSKPTEIGLPTSNGLEELPTDLSNKSMTSQKDPNLKMVTEPMDTQDQCETYVVSKPTEMDLPTSNGLEELPTDLSNTSMTSQKDLSLGMVTEAMDTPDNCETSVVSKPTEICLPTNNGLEDMSNKSMTLQKDLNLETEDKPADTPANCETSVVSKPTEMGSPTNNGQEELPIDMSNKSMTSQKYLSLEMVTEAMDTQANCETSVVSKPTEMGFQTSNGLEDMSNKSMTSQKDPNLEMEDKPVDTQDNCETSVVSKPTEMGLPTSDGLEELPKGMSNKSMTFRKDLSLEMVTEPMDTQENCETSVVCKPTEMDLPTNNGQEELLKDVSKKYMPFQKDGNLETEDKPANTQDNCETSVVFKPTEMDLPTNNGLEELPTDLSNKSMTFQKDENLEMVTEPMDTQDNCEPSVVSKPTEMVYQTNNWLNELPQGSPAISVEEVDDSWKNSVISKLNIDVDDCKDSSGFKSTNEDEHMANKPMNAGEELAFQSPKIGTNPVSTEPPNTQNETEIETLENPSSCNDWDIFDIDLNQTPKTPKDSEMIYQTNQDFAPSTIKIGDLLNDRYYVLEQLYDGIMSTVLRCWDLKGKREVVVKIPREVEDNVAMVAMEIEMLRKLHGNTPPDPRQQFVIQFYDSFNIETSVGATPCMVVELLDGTLLDLAEKSVHVSLPLDMVKNITRQMLIGLDYLHCNNIIHTDIKPENVLYSMGNGEPEDLRVKIADLGNACYADKPTNWEIQTPAYRCIEAILDSGYTTTADIWSVACVSFELATGKYLFGILPPNVPNREEFHVASIIEHLRYIPMHLIRKGRKSYLIFDEYGQMLHMSDHRNSIRNVLLDTFCWAPEDAKNFAAFLEYLLELDPEKRPSAAEALQHPWLN